MGECHRKLGARRTADIADSLKRLGFTFATKSGMSVAVADVRDPGDEGRDAGSGRLPRSKPWSAITAAV